MSLQTTPHRRDFRGQQVHTEVEKLAVELSVPRPVLLDSERICDDILARNIVARKSAQVIAASSLYTACRENSSPVTLKDLAAATSASPREIGRCYRTIINSMNIAPPNLDKATYAARVAHAVRAPADALRIALSIVDASVEKGLGGRNPMTLAAAAVYLACLVTGENSRQSDVAEAAGVSEVSVRECIKAIRRAGAA